ncbi:MAG: helix-turn-helix transcriptional regulator [Eubacterium sp.]|nr:helix-turn-helix transcriptional regulator [Eubacterium sp.]
MGGEKVLYKKRLKDLREEREISQEKIAKILGVKQSAISKYETEKRDYKIEDLIKLCKFYNVSADYILGFTNTIKSLPNKK